MNKAFTCLFCQKQVPITEAMGTANRNHCPYCLWSKHVDEHTSGDRKAKCLGMMQPIGLTFKEEGLDKWGKPKQGEIMLIHQCAICSKISINRIASDDETERILEVFQLSQHLKPTIKNNLSQQGINLLTLSDEPEIKTQLFGKKST